ncbi:MAG: hypothetical protein KBS78_03685 [Bacteroidales bacterium]|nr:hypothetical protein [Candidatus Cryptobacteroides faecihippi]
MLKKRTTLWAILMVTLATAFLASCGIDAVPDLDVIRKPGTSTDVTICLGASPSTRTEINQAADGFGWSLGDRISVWAKASDGRFVLENQVFNIYARAFEKEKAYFSSTLASPMAEGNYTYNIVYPVPESVSGTTATFDLPSTQDGKASGGTDITVSSPVSFKELAPASESDPIGMDSNAIPAELHHILHFLRFYLPRGGSLMGEPVTRIVFTMPQDIAGKVTVDITDPSSATISDGTKTITLDLKEALAESNGSTRNYAVAGIFPPASTYSVTDFMQVTMYSEGKIGTVSPICLGGRNFAAGHVTSVKLDASDVRDYYALSFRIDSNNLGENLQNIKLVLPEGTSWPGSSSNEYVHTGADGALLASGEEFRISTEDAGAFRQLSGQEVTVLYESECAIVSERVRIPDLSSSSKGNVSLNEPYLLAEDFGSLAPDFSFNDGYSGGFNTGEKDGHEFLKGWSGARVGGKAGKAIRISCRREVVARYYARCDSPFLTGLKYTSAEFAQRGIDFRIKVRFSYSMNREEGGGVTANTGQTMYFGTNTKAGILKSQDSSGSFDEGTALKETTGSYDVIDHQAEYSLSGIGSNHRLSWRTYPDLYALGNGTYHLYLDNIYVTIER